MAIDAARANTFRPKQSRRVYTLICASIEVRLWLSVIAYNPGNLRPGRPLCRVLPLGADNGSLTSLQQRLVKAGGTFNSFGTPKCKSWVYTCLGLEPR